MDETLVFGKTFYIFLTWYDNLCISIQVYEHDAFS